MDESSASLGKIVSATDVKVCRSNSSVKSGKETTAIESKATEGRKSHSRALTSRIWITVAKRDRKHRFEDQVGDVP